LAYAPSAEGSFLSRASCQWLPFQNIVPPGA
jgi:hypothetical protein